MGVYWGANLFYGFPSKNNPLYAYDEETYEDIHDFYDLEELVAYKTGKSLDWDERKEWEKETPVGIIRHYKKEIIVYLKGTYFSTYQNELLEVPILDTIDISNTDAAEEFLLEYGFVDHDWECDWKWYLMGVTDLYG